MPMTLKDASDISRYYSGYRLVEAEATNLIPIGLGTLGGDLGAGFGLVGSFVAGAAGATVGEGLQYYLLKEIPTDNQLYIDAETKKFFEVG